ncbi:MAG: site-specific integrase [Candidatus Puniceispirillum sp.]|nr:site-specific integrase [Candidatus Puniceispirillum sp.]
MPKLTKRLVESLAPVPDKIIKSWDSELKGFGVFVLPSGRRTYYFQYRNADKKIKSLKIGVHGHITTDQAREICKARAFSLAKGEDPEIARRKEANPTLGSLVVEYLSKQASKKRPKSQREDLKLLKNHILPAFEKKDLINIYTRDIQNLHLSLEKTPYVANRALALLSSLFSFAALWGYRADNPVKGIPKYQEEKRSRWLNQDELDRLLDALETHPKNTVARVLKFLVLTGARKGEALGATWDQFDLEKGVWTKPSHLTKQKKNEHLPLSQQALDLLLTIREEKAAGNYVFPGRKKGEPLKELKTFWAKILKEANIENVRIHDLRHTYASHLVSKGLSLSIVGKLLGHTQASTTQRYAHLADEPLRAATELFSREIIQKVKDDPDQNTSHSS